MVETRGTEPPAGKTRRSPAPPTSRAPKLNETAAAEAGMLHCPVITKLRVVFAMRDGGPYWPVKPLPLVSASRQGVTPMKGRGPVIAAIVETPRFTVCGDQVSGAGQLAISCPQAGPAKTTTQRPRNIRRADTIPPPLRALLVHSRHEIQWYSVTLYRKAD